MKFDLLSLFYTKEKNKKRSTFSTLNSIEEKRINKINSERRKKVSDKILSPFKNAKNEVSLISNVLRNTYIAKRIPLGFLVAVLIFFIPGLLAAQSADITMGTGSGLSQQTVWIIQSVDILLWITFFFFESDIADYLKKKKKMPRIIYHFTDIYATLLSCIVVYTVHQFGDYDTSKYSDYATSIANFDFFQTFYVLGGIITIVVTANQRNVTDIFAHLIAKAKGDPLKEYDIISGMTFIGSGLLDNGAVTQAVLGEVDLEQEDDERVNIIVGAANAGGGASPGGDSTTIYLVLIKHLISVKYIFIMYIPTIIGHFVAHMLGRNRKRMSLKSIIKPKDSESKLNWMNIIVFLLILISIPLSKGLIWGQIEYLHDNHLTSIAAVTSALFMTLIYNTIITRKLLTFNAHELEEIIKPSLLLGLMVWQVFMLGQSGLLLDYIGPALLELPLWAQILLAGVLSLFVDNMAVTALFVLLFGQIYPANHSFWLALAVSVGMSGSGHLLASLAGIIFKGKVLWTTVKKWITGPGWKSLVGWFVATIIALILLHLLNWNEGLEAINTTIDSH